MALQPTIRAAILMCLLSGYTSLVKAQLQELEIVAAESVNSDAITRAKYIVDKMLEGSPKIRQQMEKSKFQVDIIGKNQVITDLERYKDRKGTTFSGGRSYDAKLRGLGDKEACAVAEENLVCAANQVYPLENLLIHEFGHSVMLHMDTELVKDIEEAYEDAKNIYPKNIYIMSNMYEYFAEGSQAWFSGSLRTDENGGTNTREKVLSRDPKLAAILLKVYGTGTIDKYKDCKY